jgi:hypothetical protein
MEEDLNIPRHEAAMDAMERIIGRRRQWEREWR